MEQVTSKRHFFNFYGILYLCILLIAFGIFSILKEENIDRGIFTLIGLTLISISIYICYLQFKNSPKITIDKRNIQFNSKVYKIEDIEELSLMGRYIFSVTSTLDGAKITFKDGSKRYIFDSMYSNTSYIKTSLDYNVNNNKYHVVGKTKVDLSSEHLYDYKGNFIFSFRGLLFLICISFFI